MPQPGVSLSSLNLKKTSQKIAQAEDENEDCRGHDGGLLPGGSPAAGRGARLPVSRAIIASVSRCSSLGRLADIDHVGRLEGPDHAWIQGTTARKPTHP